MPGHVSLGEWSLTSLDTSDRLQVWAEAECTKFHSYADNRKEITPDDERAFAKGERCLVMNAGNIALAFPNSRLPSS